MARITAFVLLLASVASAGQVSALPTFPHNTVPPLHRYTVVREIAYRVIPTTSFGSTTSSISIVKDPATAACANTAEPEPITTANPVLGEMSEPVVVSFIVGTDGRVYSPIVLSSDGQRNDREAMRAVRTWRYRPGTCNGVPVESEGSVGFGTF